MKFTITEVFLMKTLNNFFMKQIYYETIFLRNHFLYSQQKSYQSSFTSFATYSTLAITILKLLSGPSESARVFGDPIYARGRGRAKEPSPVAFKKAIDIKLSTDDSCHAYKQ